MKSAHVIANMYLYGHWFSTILEYDSDEFGVRQSLDKYTIQ